MARYAARRALRNAVAAAGALAAANLARRLEGATSKVAIGRRSGYSWLQSWLLPPAHESSTDRRASSWNASSIATSRWNPGEKHDKQCSEHHCDRHGTERGCGSLCG